MCKISKPPHVAVAEQQWVIAQVEHLEANINALLLGASGKTDKTAKHNCTLKKLALQAVRINLFNSLHMLPFWILTLRDLRISKGVCRF